MRVGLPWWNEVKMADYAGIFSKENKPRKEGV
jgi:hypothetical protein